ncbi:Rpn family recombination-promoting nuclease/putative transposase [Treponema denticola]|uniref:Rpn family recombination-promoting nuclease/putative transposase n=1 Tax=Treponema denticola TaxID=158 RepID=UPI003D8D223A
MLKRFEDLTLQDDFMFCKVMQNPDLCKKLIEMILSDTIGQISYISVQHNINTYEQAKSVRFDVLVQTENGKFYDVEIQVSNEKNIPKRMRFYQAAIKIIINTEAFYNTKNKELKEFLEYLKTGKAKNEFTREIEAMIQTIKENEQARQEYRLMSTFEMDARYKGAYDKSIETAKLMKKRGYPISEILLMTGLPEAEIEKL